MAQVIDLQSRRPRRRGLDLLTLREADVLGLMARGLTNEAIARALGLHRGQVSRSVGVIYSKLGLEPDPRVNRRVLAVRHRLEA